MIRFLTVDGKSFAEMAVDAKFHMQTHVPKLPLLVVNNCSLSRAWTCEGGLNS